MKSSREIWIFLGCTASFAAWMMSKNLLKKLCDSGVYLFVIQAESGNRKTIEYMNRGIDLDHVREIIKYANRLGMLPYSNFIIGFWNETKADVEEFIRLAESLRLDALNYLAPVPYSHTPLYNDYVREELLNPEEPVQSPLLGLYLASEEIAGLRERAEKNHFWIRLRQILRPVSIFTELLPKIFVLARRSLYYLK